jgi:glycosyltransferase involved in cell wall biosynthesis
MRIVLASCIADSVTTGMGKWTDRVAAALRVRGHAVQCLYAQDLGNAGSRAGRLLFGARLARRLADESREIDVAVIHEPYALESALLQLTGSVPVVVMSHGLEIRIIRDLAAAAEVGLAEVGARNLWRHELFWGLRERLAFRLARRSLCLAEVDRTFLVNQLHVGGHRVTAFVNGVDPAPFTVDAGLGRDVLFIGSWIPEKGSRTLPRLWREVRRLRPESTLVLAGTGADAASVRADFDPIDRDSVGVLTAFSAAEDLRPVVERAALLVLPSLREGSPLALLEAMSYGLPVVASRVGGVPELIEEGKEGHLFPPLRPEDAAGLIVELLNNPARRQEFGLAAMARATKASWEKAAGVVETACREATSMERR